MFTMTSMNSQIEIGFSRNDLTIVVFYLLTEYTFRFFVVNMFVKETILIS